MAFWIEYFASLNPDESMAWRTPLALQLIFIFIIGIGINFFPESPRWLMKMGRHDEARDILQSTRSDSSGVEAETQQIIQNVQHEMKVASANQYTAMIFPRDKYTRGLRWRVFLAVWLQIMQELVGIGVITVYAVDLFATAGFSKTLSKLLSGFNNISYMFSVFFAVITLDRYGRRRKPSHSYLIPHALTLANTGYRNNGLGRRDDGADASRRRDTRHVRARTRPQPEEIRRWRGRNDLLLHGNVRRDLANHAMAIPNRGANQLPSYLIFSLVNGG